MTHKSPLLIAVALLAACSLDPLGDTPLGPAEGEGTFGSFVWSGGLQRTYEIHVPPTFDVGGTLPLLIFYHALGTSGVGFQNITGLDDLSLRERFVVVYPDGFGMERSWAIGSGLTLADQLGVDDILFTNTLINHISAELPIDQNRVYVAGFAEGGVMTQTLACFMGGTRIAAALIVGATPDLFFTQRCFLQVPLPMMLIIGTEDPSFPPVGSPFTLSIQETVDFWTRRFNCDVNPLVENLPDTQDDGTTVVRDTYSGCDFIHYTIEGGGGTWPGSSVAFDPVFGLMSREIDASEVIVEFMLRHTLQ